MAFVPGAPFYAGDAQNNTLRLSYVTVSAEQINVGIKSLAEAIKASL
jgi:2-aminoadipate transaminase